jgi:hypothetical protein
MPITRVALDPRDPETYVMVMQFDPRTGQVTMVGGAYAHYNRPEAEYQAAAAAERAAAEGLSVQYIVVRAVCVAKFLSSPDPGPS